LGGSSTYFEKRVVDVALHEGWGGGEGTEQYEGMATRSNSGRRSVASSSRASHTERLIEWRRVGRLHARPARDAGHEPLLRLQLLRR
jgi:hypothetical protein